MCRDMIKIFGGTDYLINENLKSIDKKRDNIGNHFFCCDYLALFENLHGMSRKVYK